MQMQSREVRSAEDRVRGLPDMSGSTRQGSAASALQDSRLDVSSSPSKQCTMTGLAIGLHGIFAHPRNRRMRPLAQMPSQVSLRSRRSRGPNSGCSRPRRCVERGWHWRERVPWAAISELPVQRPCPHIQRPSPRAASKDCRLVAVPTRLQPAPTSRPESRRLGSRADFGVRRRKPRREARGGVGLVAVDHGQPDLIGCICHHAAVDG